MILSAARTVGALVHKPPSLSTSLTVAIAVGMHATMKRPYVVNGEIKIRPIMYVALSYDHRIIDGREAVTFLKSIKSKVEDPRRMLFGL